MSKKRKFSEITIEEAQMLCFYLSDNPRDPEPESRIDADDVSVDELIPNDGGNLVSEEVAAVIRFSCRCFEGEAYVFFNGDVEMTDTDGKMHPVNNIAEIVRFFEHRGFDI